MRISEEEKPLTEDRTKTETFKKNKLEEIGRHRHQPSEQQSRVIYKRKSHFFAKLFFSCLIMLIIIAAAVGYLIFFIAGPLVKTVDALPVDFPAGLVIYQLDQAEIKIQSPASKERLIRLLDSLPEWTLQPFMNYLTTDLKTQLVAILKNPNNLPENFSLSDWSSRATSTLETQTVNLQWDDLGKTKEDLISYYKSQLLANGFTVKEKISDYEIDLSFFKPGIEGAISALDSFKTDGASILNLTVDYLSR